MMGGFNLPGKHFVSNGAALIVHVSLTDMADFVFSGFFPVAKYRNCPIRLFYQLAVITVVECRFTICQLRVAFRGHGAANASIQVCEQNPWATRTAPEQFRLAILICRDGHTNFLSKDFRW